MAWTPPDREPWVERLNALGTNLGDHGESLVSLEDASLIDAAVDNTGLSDFGDPDWREPFEVLTASLREEGRLTLTGRLLARSELQRILQQRLRLVAAWSEVSGVDRPVAAPVFVTGLGRSGTTWLHELLALDPANRAPLLGELMYPLGLPGDADHLAAADLEITLMDAIVPAFTAMHENRGHLPTECIFIFAHTFLTDMFLGQYHCPTYAMWQAGRDKEHLYRFHRRFLGLLTDDDRRWVLKAPSHLSQLDTLFRVYPDARVVITHRDPLQVVGSLADLMATLQWMRSDHVDYDAVVGLIAFGAGLQFEAITAARNSGALPADRIHDVIYRDLVADPVGVIESLYGTWDLEVSDEFRARLDRAIAERTQGRHGSHEYRFEDTGLDLATERDRVAGYMERYGVPVEVG